MTKENLQNSTSKLTYEPQQEGIETSDQSIRNLALCEIGMG